MIFFDQRLFTSWFRCMSNSHRVVFRNYQESEKILLQNSRVTDDPLIIWMNQRSWSFRHVSSSKFTWKKICYYCLEEWFGSKTVLSCLDARTQFFHKLNLIHILDRFRVKFRSCRMVTTSREKSILSFDHWVHYFFDLINNEITCWLTQVYDVSVQEGSTWSFDIVSVWEK